MRSIRIALLVVLALTIPVSSSWAINLEFADGTPYTTTNESIVFNPVNFNFDNAGSVTEFTLDQQPAFFSRYLYTGVNDYNFHEDILTTHWKFENQDNAWGVNQGTGSFVGNQGPSDWYLTFPNWTTYRTTGDWTVNVLWTIDGETKYQNDLAFKVLGPTVTPEPASMALFGLGAGALGLSRKLRKKKNS